MGQDLNTALHAALDRMGAPREDKAVSESAEGLAPEEADEEGTPGAEAEESELADDGEIPEGETDDEGEAADGAEDEGEGRKTYKVAELAEAIGWEPSDLYTDLQVPLGDGTVVTLEQLKSERDDFLAKQAEIEKTRAQIAEQQQQLQQAQQQLMQRGSEYSEAYLEAVGRVKAIEAQYANIDWDALDENDPGRAANLRQRFATGYAQAKHEADRVRAEEGARRQQEQQMFWNNALVREDQRLMQLVPEWKSMEVVQQEVPKINEYLYSMGFRPEELQYIVDGRARAIARDAWKWRQHQSQLGEVKKVVGRKKPKPVLRPGRGNTSVQASERRVQALEQRAMQTQKQEDKLTAAREIFNQSRKKRRA